mmetsp:Transcript_59900/g.128525  ORF Transcript_59900/g.128525 Transcript_59900/m.128525 type:complete len:190 (+) Transcript_59900:159-728(+)
MFWAKLRERASRPISIYAAWSRAWPMPVAFTTCWVKGSASDVVSQKLVERKSTVDWQRTLSFATFSGAYGGCAQHYVYNVIFSRLFGSAMDLSTALKKVVADGLVHAPCVCMPCYFAFEDTMLGYGPLSGLRRYSVECIDCLKPYWCVWTIFHLFNFLFTPPELRIGLVACMSLIWLTIFSYITHRKRL